MLFRSIELVCYYGWTRTVRPLVRRSVSGPALLSLIRIGNSRLTLLSSTQIQYTTIAKLGPQCHGPPVSRAVSVMGRQCRGPSVSGRQCRRPPVSGRQSRATLKYYLCPYVVNVVVMTQFIVCPFMKLKILSNIWIIITWLQCTHYV